MHHHSARVEWILKVVRSHNTLDRILYFFCLYSSTGSIRLALTLCAPFVRRQARATTTTMHGIATLNDALVPSLSRGPTQYYQSLYVARLRSVCVYVLCLRFSIYRFEFDAMQTPPSGYVLYTIHWLVASQFTENRFLSGRMGVNSEDTKWW